MARAVWILRVFGLPMLVSGTVLGNPVITTLPTSATLRSGAKLPRDPINRRAHWFFAFRLLHLFTRDIAGFGDRVFRILLTLSVSHGVFIIIAHDRNLGRLT
jgi:hypothetical protein